MPDQSLLNPLQDELQREMTIAWESARAAELGDPVTLLQGARCAHAGLMQGGTWPDSFWLENIFMVGANCCACGVLNLGMYDEMKQLMEDLYGEVIRLKWTRGGPSGFFDENEAAGLSRAVGQWQVHRPSA